MLIHIFIYRKHYYKTIRNTSLAVMIRNKKKTLKMIQGQVYYCLHDLYDSKTVL